MSAEARPLTVSDMQTYLYSLRERLPMWVVYDHPSDRPDVYVARLWLSLPQPLALPMTLASKNLDALRDELAALGLAHLDRNPGDDPAIMEVWL